MTRFVRIVAFVLGLVVVGSLSGIFLWNYGMRALAVPLCATLGALIAMLISEAIFRGVMTGIASIVGGVIGSMANGSGVSPCVHSELPAAPYVVFVGAVLGGTIWIIRLSIPLFNRGRNLRKSDEDCQRKTDGRQRTSEYLSVALGAFVVGLVLGAIFFLVYYVGVGIDPLDQWYLFGHEIRGPVGALLCAMSFGAIGGLLVAVPYFMAWLMQVAAQGPGQQSSEADKESRKQAAK